MKNIYIDYTHEEDFLYLREIVDNDVRNRLDGGDTVKLFNFGVNTTEAEELLLNQLYWDTYSDRKIGNELPGVFKLKMRKKLGELKDYYDRLLVANRNSVSVFSDLYTETRTDGTNWDYRQEYLVEDNSSNSSDISLASEMDTTAGRVNEKIDENRIYDSLSKTNSVAVNEINFDGDVKQNINSAEISKFNEDKKQDSVDNTSFNGHVNNHVDLLENDDNRNDDLLLYTDTPQTTRGVALREIAQDGNDAYGEKTVTRMNRDVHLVMNKRTGDTTTETDTDNHSESIGNVVNVNSSLNDSKLERIDEQVTKNLTKSDEKGIVDAFENRKESFERSNDNRSFIENVKNVRDKTDRKSLDERQRNLSSAEDKVYQGKEVIIGRSKSEIAMLDEYNRKLANIVKQYIGEFECLFLGVML